MSTCVSAWKEQIKTMIFTSIPNNVQQILPAFRWTKETVLADAQLYKSRFEWAKKSRGAHGYAERHGISDECYRHMGKVFSNTKWTKETVLADARLYKSRSEWSKKSGSAYGKAKILGCFEECVSHMRSRGGTNNKPKLI